MQHEVEDERPPKDLLKAGEIIAYRYRVQRCRRNHPLGELYECHDQTHDQPVLLQRLRREFAAPEVRDRLFETRASAAMEASAIVDILDYGEDLDGRSFLVTRCHDDASLTAVERPLSFTEAVKIVERVAAALEPVHERRLVHGGIEPASILVDEARELRGLLGFGLVPALGMVGEATRTLPLVVSPAYAAPELIRGQPLSPAADVYALGILLWELIFGVVPFRGPTLRVLDSHLNRGLPELELPFDAPSSFGWILRRMLAKNPVDRFPDAGAVCAQLSPFCVGDAVEIDDLVGEDELEAEDLDVEVEVQGELEAEDLDDETVVFDRMPEGTQAVPVLHLMAEVPVVSRFPPRRLALRAASLVALVSFVLLGWRALSGGEIVAQSMDTDSTQARGSARVGTPVQVVAEAPTTPKAASTAAKVEVVEMQEPAISDEEAVTLARIGPSKFRARKRELYGHVGRRCVAQRVRRTVKVAVRVDTSGKVDAATVIGGMASTKLGRCTRRQARRLSFPASEEGGFYVYTIRLR